MGMQPNVPPTVQLRDFNGLVTRPDPDDIPPGSATLLVNMTCITPGKLSLRPGLRQVNFEEN